MTKIQMGDKIYIPASEKSANTVNAKLKKKTMINNFMCYNIITGLRACNTIR
jgi:hypothetical protein